MILSYEEKYDILTTKHSISAREYFMILRLAIYHIDGENLETSYRIMQYGKSNEVYESACRILEALYEKEGVKNDI